MKDRILPDHWSYRPETWDWNIFDSVVTHNEYALPDRLPPDSLVLDIGAHIGSFSWACHLRGAAAIVAYEAATANFGLLQSNLAPVPRAVAHHAAVWTGGGEAQVFEPHLEGPNTGGFGVFANSGEPVRAIPLGNAIADANAWSGLPRVRLMKLDCEGSEYPILTGADLTLVDAVCGELHDGVEWQGRTWTSRDAADLLLAAGFRLRVTPLVPGFWHFWADKPSFYSWEPIAVSPPVIDPSPESTTGDIKQVLRELPAPWPEHWMGWPNVAAAFREMFAEASRELPARPTQWGADRGIVICAGGWRFFPSLYVTVRMIRHVGCDLPIQVWYLGDQGEYDERMRQALAPYDVGWIDANAFAREHGIVRRILGGWELKPFAALHAPFREVISLDADCYPAYNPIEFLETTEFQRVGAAFWPDQGKLEPGQWERFGLPYHDEPAWESGQFIVDKARHWQPLALADWLNDHSDYVYRHIYGDKDTYHLAWRKLGHEVCVPTREPGWESIAFVQKDFGGRPLFIHRTRDKFRWHGEIDGQDVPRHYMTEQWHPTNLFVAGLPHEQVAHDFCRESSELLRPEMHFA